MTALPSRALTGTIRVPGDKSISHRALMLGGLAVGETRIEGMLEGEDVLRTGQAMRALGARIARTDAGVWIVQGVGVGGMAEPTDVLDLGNSGTSARLLLGILASHPLTAFLTGDASLRRRPMRRVIEPLERIGARFVTRAGGYLPLAVTGSAEPLPITYRLPVASAQVKSAILLAGLNAPGQTTVVEPQPSRDHTEIMLRHFGATLKIEAGQGAERIVTIKGEPELAGRAVWVPGDPSSAAFPVVAALICPDSDLTITGVGINPLRAGLFETLTEMGAAIAIVNRRDVNGEAVADLRVRSSTLKAIDVPAERAPRMIDEYPILAVAAAYARGRTVFRGIGELKVKESDRLAAIARGLIACGVAVEAGDDTLAIQGLGGPPEGGASVATELDHRIAMSFLVLGLGAKAPTRVDDAGPIATSFPGFVELMTSLGARIAAR